MFSELSGTKLRTFLCQQASTHCSPPPLPSRSSANVLVLGCWKGFRRVSTLLFWAQQLWLNKSIPVLTLCTKSELLPPPPSYWPHDHCRQGIHWVLMVRHTRMWQWLSLCHFWRLVGKLLKPIPATYVYHDKPLTHRFTLVIRGKPPTHASSQRHNYLSFQSSSIYFPFLFLCPNENVSKKVWLSKKQGCYFYFES